MSYTIIDTTTGNDCLAICDEPFRNIQDARDTILEWENLDREYGKYIPGKYEIRQLPDSMDAPASKEDERKALKKIERIIEKLGPGSYLETSFAGFKDLALQNIDDDSAITWPDRLQACDESFRIDLERRDRKISELREKYAAAKVERADAIERAERAEAEAQKAAAGLEKMTELYNAAREREQENAERAQAAEAENEALKAEILTLKAKLYDLITK